LLSDVTLAAWVAMWSWAGFHVKRLIDELAAPGRAIERAGGGFATTLGDVSVDVAGVPLVGETLQEPFRGAAAAGAALQQAGQHQQDVVHAVALWVGLLLALIPISYALYRYVPDRFRWVREATAAERLAQRGPDLKVFALRAIVNRPLHELTRVSPNPVEAFDRGDFGPLATIELEALGLRGPK